MKLNHLRGKGKATLRSRVAAENEWLTQSTSLHQPPKKQSHSTSDQNHSWTRRRAAQVEVEAEPGIILADADPMEVLPEPVTGQNPPTIHAVPNPLPKPVAGQVPPTPYADADLVELLPEPAFDQLHVDAGDLLPEPNGILSTADPPPEPVAGHVPPTLYTDADPMELLPEPAFDQVHADADANSGDPLPDPNVILAMCQEILKGIMEERWGNGVLHEDSSEAADDNSNDKDDTLAVPEDKDKDDDEADDEDKMKMKTIVPHFLSLMWLAFLFEYSS